MGSGYTFQPLSDTDHILWDQYLDEIESGTFFHRSAWLEFIKEQFNLHLTRYLILHDDVVVGLFPCFKKKMPILKVAGSPLVAENNPYLGFVLQNNVDKIQFFQDFENFIKISRIDFIRLSFDNIIYNDLFKENGYNIKEKKSFRLDLSQDIDDLWKGIGTKGRNLVRKAEKNDFQFAVMSKEQYLNHYYKMSIDVYDKQKISPILSEKYYINFYNRFSNSPTFDVFCVSDGDGVPVAATIIVSHKGRAYYLDGVSFRKYQQYGINNFIQWNIIKQLKINGIKIYDFLGGDIEGIAKFKLSFGSINHPCIYVDKSVSNIASISKNAYSKVKSIEKKIKYYLNR